MQQSLQSVVCGQMTPPKIDHTNGCSSDTLLRHVKSHDPRIIPVPAENMLSSAAVGGTQAGPPLNDYSGSQNVMTVDFQQQDSTTQDWHASSQTLQPLSQAGAANLADDPGHFSTAQPQDTEGFYASCRTHSGASETSHNQDPISIPLSIINGDSPLSANYLWGDSLISSGPPWLIGYDFDLEALNTSVSATLDISQPLFQSRVGFQNIQPILEGQADLAAEVQQRCKPGTDKVRASWFNQIEPDGLEDATHGGTNTGQLTPVTDGNQYDIGDNFRSRITARLKAPTYDDPLPSTKFLVSWLSISILYSFDTNKNRTILSRFTSPNSIRYFLSFTDKPFAQVLRTPCYCFPLRLSVVYSSDREPLRRKELGYSKGLTKLSWLL